MTTPEKDQDRHDAPVNETQDRSLPRSFPPSFNPANILESTMDTIKEKKALTEGLDLDRIRGNLNRMIEQQLQQRGVK
jgi:hypothetical protein